jgi:4-diphosphocytidyl-2-C-methyl-D-erythritol kinase
VPWFFTGSAAIVSGRGERVEPVAGLPDLAAVIACPSGGLSTKEVYARCIPDASRRGGAARLVTALKTGGLAAAEPHLVNALEAPARSLSTQIDGLLAALADAGGFAPRLTGSGSACFSLASTVAEAEAIAARLRNRSGHSDALCAVFAVRCTSAA